MPIMLLIYIYIYIYDQNLRKQKLYYSDYVNV